MKKSFYFLSILILFLFNSISVNALETNFTNLYVKGYNNNGNSLSEPNVFNCNEVGSCGMEITTLANSYGGAWGIQSPILFISNHSYSVTLNIRSSNAPITISSKYRVAIGQSMEIARDNYTSSNYSNDLKIYRDAGNNTLQYVFKSNIDASYIIIPFTTLYNTTANFMIDNIVIEDLGSEGLSEAQINNILNNQTNIIKNDIDSINTSIKDSLNDCIKNEFPFPYAFTSGNYNGVEVTINSDGSVKLLGTASTATFLNFAYTDILRGYLPTSYDNFNPQYWCSINGYCLTPDWGFGYTENGSVVWFLLASGQYYDKTIYPMITKGSVPSEFIRPGTEVCKSKLDNFNDTQKETNNKLDDLNDNLTNSDSSGASSDASNFFSNFNTDTFGLTSVITAPLELIKSVTSKTCTPLQLTLPFVNKELNLPCLSSIYENHFGSFLTIYRTITFGFVSYWVCIKIFNLVKDFKNPEHDEIEVLDL